MKGTRCAWLALAAVALLSGCKGFWNAPSDSGGGGGTGTTASGVFYVLNQKTAQIAAYSLAAKATSLTAVTGSPYALSAAPLAVAMAPGGGYLYVSTAGGIFAYSVGSSGGLSILNSGQAITGDPATAMVVDSRFNWLLEGTTGAGTVTAIPISSTTGLLDNSRTAHSLTLPSTTTLVQLAISPATSTNPNLYAAMGNGGTAYIPFTSANANPFGAATTIGVKNTTGGANAVAVDPSDRLLYVGETVAVTGTQTGGLRVFTLSSGKPTEVSGSPFASGGTGPTAILPLTSYVYVANKAVSGSSSGNVTGYPISTTGTAYSLGSIINTIAAGQITVGLAVDSSSTYLFAVNQGGSPDLNVYTFDSTTAGKLDSLFTAATGSDPVTAVAVVAAP